MPVHPFIKTACAIRCIAAALLPLTIATTIQSSEVKKVDSVVATEASGQPVNRREALAKETDQNSQWQAGRILIDGKWLDIESTHEPNLSPKIEAYRQQRDSQTLDAEDHRRMAKWCQSHQLPEMAKVHWKAVVATDINDEQARKELGHKRVGNDWLTDDELKQAANEQKQAISELKQWMPQVRKIVAKMRSADTQTKLEGMKDLDKIAAIAAVPALKFGVFQLESTIALPLVSKIKAIRSKPSCLALCEIAVYDPNSEVGRLAIEGLKQYDEHFYVPELLQMLEMPTELKQEFIYFPNGSLAIRRAYTRENADTKEQIEVLKLITLVSADSAFYVDNRNPIYSTSTSMENLANGFVRTTMSTTSTSSMPFSVHVMNPQAAAAAKKLSEMTSRSEKEANDIANQFQKQRELNVKSVLAAISGLPEDAPSSAYWNWWPKFNESATNEKALIHRYTVDDSQTINLVTNASGSAGITSTTGPRSSIVDTKIRQHNCLVAGTVVQTSEGLKNIEAVLVGDMITSIDIETGEIALRPAIVKTVRAADSTYLMTLTSGEKIRATGGHCWWIVGKGWVRSRDLATGQYMRTGNSSVEITKVEKTDAPINVYNMIVDENHTYFVGKDRLLSWDVTSLQPTLQTAPGQTNQTYLVSK